MKVVFFVKNVMYIIIRHFIRMYLISLLPYLWCSSWDKSVKDIERPLEDWPPSTADADFPPVLLFNLRCRFGEPSWEVSDLDFFVEAWKKEEFGIITFAYYWAYGDGVEFDIKNLKFENIFISPSMFILTGNQFRPSGLVKPVIKIGMYILGVKLFIASASAFSK